MGMIQPYEDRKKLKWQGFFLSEHTTEIDTETQRQFHCPPKEALSSEEINQCLFEAMKKNRAVAIQREEVDQEGHYPPDITGKISGYDSLGIYLSGESVEKIHYDEIRHVAFFEDKKWFDVT
ncbi:hypothetical protein [Enterococcus sp. DIV0876]|uniref:hypothetical protein n=1 Tax=Enterococcus sp. DIV0876 TaxID=2774633 RepID=UPI003D2F9C4E